MTESLFGTDGIRGKANEGVLTAESCLRLGRAIGSVAKGQAFQRCAILGHDGRRSAGMIGNALAAGLLAEGIELDDAGLLSTPALAWLARRHRYGLGIMISASHNPATDNGIKIFGPRGEKLEDRVTQEIERRYFHASKAALTKLGQTRAVPHLVKDYCIDLAQKSLPKLQLKGMKLVLDCANGGASQIGPQVLSDLGAKVVTVSNRPNGDNINERCGALYPKQLANRVRREKARLGISLDGDADRCILCDEKGQIVDGDGILIAMAQDLLRRKRLPQKTVVTTVMSNFGMRRAAEQLGIRLEIVGVGDRKVVEALKDRNLTLGGEQSGHIIFGRDRHYIGDGLYTAVRVLDLMRRSGKPLSELVLPFRSYPQVLKNIPVKTKPPLETQPRIWDAVHRAESALNGSGRVLVRYSGTESLARVMIEGPDSKQIHKWADEICLAIQQELS